MTTKHQRPSDRAWIDRISERNERAANIRRIRRGPWWKRVWEWIWRMG